MMQNLWKQFPRLIEERLAQLLDEALPKSPKAFQLYKSCQSENLWRGTFENFSQHLDDFFSLHRSERRKSSFDRYLERPMDSFVFEGFSLTFRTAAVSKSSVRDLANWAANMMRIGLKMESEILSVKVLDQTFTALTEPPPGEKDINLDFEDFCYSLRKMAFKYFGKNLETDLNTILKELDWLQHQLRAEEQQLTQKALNQPIGIYLTQTETDWAMAMQKAVLYFQEAPRFPLSRGPEKKQLVDLSRVGQLYNLIQNSKDPTLIEKQAVVRNTLLSLCEDLLIQKVS